MRLYFIRHAQSQNNALYEETGSDDGRVDDPCLTAIGQEQAALTARFLSSSSDPVDRLANGVGFDFTHLYCSPMYRAIVTAKPIAEALDMPLRVWTDWHETGGIFLEDKRKGEFIIRPGLNRSGMEQLYPKLMVPDSIGETGWWNRPFETDDERPIRARRVYHELLERHGGSDDRVAVISHGGFYMHFLSAVMGVDYLRSVWFRMYNCAVTRFDFEGGEQTVVYHNFTAHLPSRLIT